MLPSFRSRRVRPKWIQETRKTIHLHIIERIRMIIASFLTAYLGHGDLNLRDKTNTLVAVGRAKWNRGRKSLTIREIREAPSAEYISDVPLRT